MPTVAIIDGVAIVFYHNDHPPAHFHTKFGEHQAIFEIESLLMTEGFLPIAKRRIVQEWAATRRDALRAAFLLATAGQRVGRIE